MMIEIVSHHDKLALQVLKACLLGPRIKYIGGKEPRLAYNRLAQTVLIHPNCIIFFPKMHTFK